MAVSFFGDNNGRAWKLTRYARLLTDSTGTETWQSCYSKSQLFLRIVKGSLLISGDEQGYESILLATARDQAKGLVKGDSMMFVYAFQNGVRKFRVQFQGSGSGAADSIELCRACAQTLSEHFPFEGKSSTETIACGSQVSWPPTFSSVIAGASQRQQQQPQSQVSGSSSGGGGVSRASQRQQQSQTQIYGTSSSSVGVSRASQQQQQSQISGSVIAGTSQRQQQQQSQISGSSSGGTSSGSSGGLVGVSSIVQSLLKKDGCSNLNSAYQRLQPISDVDLRGMVHLCLLDPTFPAFVGRVEGVLKSVVNGDKGCGGSGCGTGGAMQC